MCAEPPDLQGLTGTQADRTLTSRFLQHLIELVAGNAEQAETLLLCVFPLMAPKCGRMELPILLTIAGRTQTFTKVWSVWMTLSFAVGLWSSPALGF